MIDKTTTAKTYIQFTLQGYKRIARLTINFVGAVENIKSFVNTNLINKGNYDLFTVADLNNGLGVTLLKAFKFMAYDTNNLGYIGVFSGNANLGNSIRMYTTIKNNISYQPNPIGGETLFIR